MKQLEEGLHSTMHFDVKQYFGLDKQQKMALDRSMASVLSKSFVRSSRLKQIG